MTILLFMTSSLLPSPKRERGETVNMLSPASIDAIIKKMYEKGRLVDVKRIIKGTIYTFPKCTLACTLDPKGKPKYAQTSITKYLPATGRSQEKALVHLIYWRYTNGYKLIPEDLEISHRDADHTVLNLTAEVKPMNESRKYCHQFGYWKAFMGESRARCPHKECPCTGP